jgi:hypothetical protein
VPLYTSAGSVVLTLYDTTMHAKGGLPADDFFRNADAAVVFFAANDRDRCVVVALRDGVCLLVPACCEAACRGKGSGRRGATHG